MRSLTLFFFVVLVASIGNAQKHDYVWMFGYNSNATSEYPGIEGSLLDFKQTPLSVAYQPIALSLNVSNASICDANGDLLFYCNGCAIANKEHEVMENGDSLNIGEIHNLYCIDGYPAGSQSVLIIPAPDSENIYYVFYKWMQFENPQGLFVTFDTLFLAAVDMSLNNGLGTVLEKNVPIITEKMTAGQLTAVKHANGRDWWILTSADTSNIYLSLLITEDGVLGPFEQTIGMKSSKNGSRGGQAVFSPDGEKYIRYSPQDGVFLFDFDRTQGTLSNFIHLPVENGGLGAGVAVSPNSNFLYVSANDTLYQYNLQSDDINSSSTIVSIYDGYLSPFPTLFHNAQLAPDCKIYINSFATVDVLHVIQNPDEPGLACNVEQHAIQLPFNHRRSLPSFPNYRLGPLVEGEDPPPPCQPVVSAQETARGNTPKAYLFPNPAPGYFKVAFETAPLLPGQIFLYNTLGRLAYEGLLAPGQQEQRFEVQGLPAGLYYCVLKGVDTTQKAERLVIIR